MASRPAISTLIEELSLAEPPVDPETDPGGAFRQLYDGWVKQGGYDRGKPRHAMRKIKEWLGDDPVRSLETKLAGKTWMQREDASQLLRLFLKKWKFNKNKSSYVAFRTEDLESTVTNLLEELFTPGTKAILLPTRTKNPPSDKKKTITSHSIEFNQFSSKKSTQDILRENFKLSDALITISRERTLVGDEASRAISEYQNMTRDMFRFSNEQSSKCALIWIVDLGMAHDSGSFSSAISNLDFLATKFRSVALTDGEDKEEHWRWLNQNTIILVGSLERKKIANIYDEDQVVYSHEEEDFPWFQAQRLTFDTIPTKWIGAPELSVFEQGSLDLWNAPTITAHLRGEGWSENRSSEVNHDEKLTYFFHGLTNSSRKKIERISVPLPDPGMRWSDGFCLACSAAFGRLRWDFDEKISPIEPKQALAQLRRQNFAALKLDEFCQLSNRLVFGG